MYTRLVSVQTGLLSWETERRWGHTGWVFGPVLYRDAAAAAAAAAAAVSNGTGIVGLE
jgi:hypothetical protein